MKVLFSLFALLIMNPQAYAVMTVTGVSGVSSWSAAPNSTTGTDGTTTVTNGTATLSLFGGTATATGAPPSGTTIVNTCNTTSPTCTPASVGTDQTPLCSCNEQAISGSTLVAVSVTKDSGNIGTLRISYNLAQGTPGTELIQAGSTSNTVLFTWDQICGVMTSGGVCSGHVTANVALTIWDDKNGNDQWDSGEDVIQVQAKLINPGDDYNIFGAPNSEGVGEFTPFPGDNRIYIQTEDFNTTTNWPNLTYGSSVAYIRVFLSDQAHDGMDSAYEGKAIQTSDIAVGTDGTLSQRYIDGVDNDKLYFVRLALLDQAKNLIQYFPDYTTFTGNCTGASPDNTCEYSVTPEKVLGLLTKDMNCFIATAAYGSSLEPRLEILRTFRQQILRHAWGKSFVLGYYKYGPYAARFIADKPAVRAVARTMLWPVVGYSWLSLKIGFYPASGVALALLMTLIGASLIVLRRVRA